MSDRELLELAAKAAGYAVNFDDFACNSRETEYWNETLQMYWNPLNDDGDALRLAVKLGISIVHRRTFISDGLVAVAAARWADDYDDTETMYDGNPAAATRRAIVRAAAALAPKETAAVFLGQEK